LHLFSVSVCLHFLCEQVPVNEHPGDQCDDVDIAVSEPESHTLLFVGSGQFLFVILVL